MLNRRCQFGVPRQWDSSQPYTLIGRANSIVLCSLYHCYFHMKRTNNFCDNFKLFLDKLHQLFLVDFVMTSCICLFNNAWKRRWIFMKFATPWWFCACGIVCNSHIILRLILYMALQDIEENLWSSAKWRWILENQNELRAERPNKKRRYSKICKKQKNGWAGSRDADGRKKNT